jgi:DNA-directed RNA polymerase beta subunit
MSRSQFGKWPIAQLVYLSFLPATDNQEDALVANRGYFARGGGASSMYKTYFSQCEDSEQFAKIDRNISKGYNYGLVDPQAHIPREIGLAVNFGDVIISKVQSIGNELINRSTTYDQNY